MYNMMKKQNFGVEIELTGITREQAANVIATYFGPQARYLGTYYKTYGATDRKGRTWKAMSDGSIKTERKTSQGSRKLWWHGTHGTQDPTRMKKHYTIWWCPVAEWDGP